MSTDVINAIPVPAMVITSQDTLAHVNDAFRKAFPLVQTGRSYLTVLRQPRLVELVEALKKGQTSGEIELVISGLTQNTYRATGGHLGDKVLICLQDLNETTAAIQLRQDFVADLSHELKTPLTAISGILETGDGDPDALQHFLPILTQEVDRMKQLVADLLILSRVESNKRRKPSQIVELRSVLDAACAPLDILARETDVRIEKKLPDDTIQFQGDRDEIIRAVMNLVENGLRYGARGGVVQVSGALCERPGGGKGVLIEVSNDGPGVQDHHIPRLTERFYRVDEHRSRNSGGSGLGLSIVKHVVNHHRGRMSIENRDTGFCVSLVLPQEQSATA